jgi:hypothetical protein
VIVATAQAAAPVGAFTTKGAYSFRSAPQLHPPKLHTEGRTKRRSLASGFFFLANFKNLTINKPMVGEGGPLILDKNLQPVWFFPVGKKLLAGDLKLQRYNGKPALSWWQGVISNVGVTLSGQVVVVDQHYRTIGKLTAPKASGWVISEHDVAIQGHTAWVTAYKDVPGQNLMPFGGRPNGTVTDCAVQQYDLKTGKLLYTWSAMAHIPLTASESRPAPAASPKQIPWDAYHENSVQLVGNGRFLVSMRNTWAAYLVDIKTGNIVWTLGGKTPSFTAPRAAQFHFQHDVEMHRRNVVSVFDDNCCAITGPGKFAPPFGPSRGLVLKLDTTHHTVKLLRKYVRAPKFAAAFLGNAQLLGNGNVMIGWGSQPFFSEYSKRGKLLIDVRWPGPNLSYRAYVQRWVGKPYFPPSGAVRRRGSKTTVYASWDGATEVARWRVLAGSSGKHLKRVATASKRGFETAISVSGSFKAFKVQALDRKGHVLGTSGVFPKKKRSSSGPGFY